MSLGRKGKDRAARRSRRWSQSGLLQGTVAIAAAGVVTVGVAAVGVRADQRDTRLVVRESVVTHTAAAVAPPVTTPPAGPKLAVAPYQQLATPAGTIADYASPNGAQIGTLGTWYGYVDVLPVYARRTGWLEVGLPQRPNMSTAWIKASQVTLSRTAWHIVVDLATTHMTVYRTGLKVWSFPVGVGLPATPTPTGRYFVSVHEPVGNSLYGPVILDTSAHSDVIQSWEGMGDAIVAIHGPIDPEANAEIGTTGAQVSNGCIRMHIADVEKLWVIPPGTPVDIVG